VTARIQALQALSVAELREEWRRVMGEEPRSRNRAWLWRRLAWAIQAKEFGGLSARAKRHLEELSVHAETWMPLGKRAFRGLTSTPVPRRRDPRLPTPGTVITRSYRGRTIAVTVMEDGFEYEDRRYKSLTAVAKAVSGLHQNGFAFFGLTREHK
jgi:hypothetical protein